MRRWNYPLLVSAAVLVLAGQASADIDITNPTSPPAVTLFVGNSSSVTFTWGNVSGVQAWRVEIYDAVHPSWQYYSQTMTPAPTDPQAHNFTVPSINGAATRVCVLKVTLLEAMGANNGQDTVTINIVTP